MKTSHLLVLSAVVAGLAYFVYEPLPEGWEQPWKTRLFLSSLRLLDHMAKGVNMFGVDGTNFTRTVGDTLAPVIRDSNRLDNLVKTRDIELRGIPVRLYEPKASSSKQKKSKVSPGLVYYHGGGWTIGNVESHDLLVKRMVHDLQVVAISVEYRLAPEFKFPAPFNDCFEATKYFLSNAKEFGVDKDRIALAGDSAGGNLVAAISQRIRDENFAPKAKLQVMFYPSLQLLDLQTPSFQANRNGPLLTSQAVGVYFSNYIAGHSRYAKDIENNRHVPQYIIEYMRTSFMNNVDLPMDNIRRSHKVVDSPEKSDIFDELKDVITNPYVSPLFADDLRNLPPAYITACQHDVLRDDSIWYTERLRNAGVEVKLDVLPCFHAWNIFTEDLISANNTMEKLITFVKRRL